MPTVTDHDIAYLRVTADGMRRSETDYTRGVSAGLLLALALLGIEEGQA